MQSGREVGSLRRARVPCPHCGELVDLARMRAHLREAHHTGSAELESSFLLARKEARRTARNVRR